MPSPDCHAVPKFLQPCSGFMEMGDDHGPVPRQPEKGHKISGACWNRTWRPIAAGSLSFMVATSSPGSQALDLEPSTPLQQTTSIEGEKPNKDRRHCMKSGKATHSKHRTSTCVKRMPPNLRTNEGLRRGNRLNPDSLVGGRSKGKL